MAPPETPLLRVAIDTPLYRLFDYLPPSGTSARGVRPGMRVRVPFGRQRRVGVVWSVGAGSEVPRARLRRALEVLDETPLLDAGARRLVEFASRYYHHPPGEVYAAALPAMLRQGRALHETLATLALTPAGAAEDLDVLARRARRQAALLGALREAGGEAGEGWLDERCPGWRRVRGRLIELGWIGERTARSEAPAPPAPEIGGAPRLGEEQAAALEAIAAGSAEGYQATVLDGVTGSGKTEVYLQLVARSLAAGRQALLLVPEIGLTPQLVARIERRLGLRPALLHSGLSDGERLAAWRRCREGSAGVALGTRSAVFAPLARLGLVIVDEEHDASFKQQEGFRYSARDLAVVRAQQAGVPVVLGSATASLESLANAATGRYRHVRLDRRAGGAAPPAVRLVDLGRHGGGGLAPTLTEAIDRHLGDGGQALVYLNRRGYAPTLVCGDCGHIVECGRCDARLTLHAALGRLRCHHCGAERAIDADCERCGGALRAVGEGTERVEEALRRTFPGRRILRVDSDSVQRRGAVEAALDEARSGEAEILVGTQMLSKGHHFPRLTLVGVVNADQGLFSSDFRSSERLAQALIQVAGRAGRADRPGEVLVQTAFPHHPLLELLVEHGYRAFVEAALAERRAAGWPPYARLALLTSAATRRETALAFLTDARAACEPLLAPGVECLGPVPAVMERRAGRYRCQLLVRSSSRRALQRMLEPWRRRLEALPSARRTRWALDVDPIEL